MRVSPNHQTPRESIILQNNLVDDTTSGFPEANSEFGPCGSKEVVDLGRRREEEDGRGGVKG